jgi:hypothetical protein
MEAAFGSCRRRPQMALRSRAPREVAVDEIAALNADTSISRAATRLSAFTQRDSLVTALLPPNTPNCPIELPRTMPGPIPKAERRDLPIKRTRAHLVLATHVREFSHSRANCLCPFCSNPQRRSLVARK